MTEWIPAGDLADRLGVTPDQVVGAALECGLTAFTRMGSTAFHYSQIPELASHLGADLEADQHDAMLSQAILLGNTLEPIELAFACGVAGVELEEFEQAKCASGQIAGRRGEAIQ